MTPSKQKSQNIELKMHKARKIINSGRSLSQREFDYDVPYDLEREMRDFDDFVSIGRYSNKPFKKHLMISVKRYGHNIFVDLQKPIVEALIKAWRKYK